MKVNFQSTYTIVLITEKDRWNSYIKKSFIYDFYHTWYYNSLDKSGEPFLFIHEIDSAFVAIPLIKRAIDKSEYFDCTSVYGYSGPISNMPFRSLTKDLIEGFKEAFLNFMRSENIVSVFSRLHPIINQEILLECLGGIYNNGKTVVVDLTLPIEEQRHRYRKAIRQKVNQLRRRGYVVREATTDEEVSSFVKIYNENMVKVNASSYYFFDDEYFFRLLRADDFESKLILAYYNDEITSGGLVTLSNNIMQFHLAATSNNYLKEGPMKLLFDEACLIGRNLGMEFLHLGGGVGGKEDSLYNFKTGFSDVHLNFTTWRFIANLSVYNSLVEQRSKEKPLGTRFPLYRS